MKGHLFPYDIEAGLFAGYRCRDCGSGNRLFKVRFPVVRPQETQVELIYRLQCSCGKWGSAKLKIPILLYAFLRTWKHLRAVQHAHPFACPTRQYLIDAPNCLDLAVNDYARLVRELPREADAASDVDRLLLGMGQEGWRDFIRRGELEPDEDGEEDISEPE